jgi:hypothetical protein
LIFCAVIFPLSFSQKARFFLRLFLIWIIKTCDYTSEYTIPGYPLCRASQTVQKRFEVTPLYLCSRREKTTWGGNFLWKMKLKSCSAALQFRTPFDQFFSFLSHVHLRHFSCILEISFFRYCTKSTLIVWYFVSNKRYFIEQKRGKQYVIFLVLGKLFKRCIPCFRFYSESQGSEVFTHLWNPTQLTL